MVAICEYRIILPFTVEEYRIAQLYMVAKFSASESSEDNGDGVEVLKNEPFEDRDQRGQYTHKLYHLASKLPSWLVSLLPKKALVLEEEAWNAYPRCTTVLKCPYFNKFRLILETTHLPDRGTTENALSLDQKTLKKRQVEYIDIATDPVENYVEAEDPAKFKSKRTGRGPLQENWFQKCEPVMCAYKCVTVDVPYWGFGNGIEKFISRNAQRKILLEGHRKCFCWLDEWHGLTMDDVRKMEYETAEAMAKARQIALGRAARVGEEDQLCDALECVAVDQNIGVNKGSVQDDQPLTPRLSVRGSKSNSPLSRSNTPRSGRDFGGSPSLIRRPSLVGPSIAVGITTLSASDVDDLSLGGSAPPLPLSQWSSLSAQTKKKEIEKESGNGQAASEELLRNGSCESFGSHHSNAGLQDMSAVPLVEDSPEVAQCVDVLDRAINWTKLRAAKGGPGSKASGKIAPLEPASVSEDRKVKQGAKDVEHCVGVLATAVSVVQKRPAKVK